MNKNKKIKVGILINNLRIGGAEKLAVSQVNLLDKNKFIVYLITLYNAKKENFKNEVMVDQVNFIELSFKKLWDLGGWRSLFCLFKKEKLDILCTHLFESNFVGRFLAIICKISTVFSFEHSLYFNKNLWQKVVDYFLAFFTDKIFTDSKAIIDFTTKQEKININKFELLYYPISKPDLTIYDKEKTKKELNISEGDFYCVNVGRFADEKGQKYIIEAARQLALKYKNIKFIIAGAGYLYDELVSMVNNYGLGDNVKILDLGKEAKKALLFADCFILSSTREGQPIALLEAMSLGVPPIAAAVGGVPEVIRENETGLLFDNGNVHQLINCIIKMYKDDNLRKEISKKSIKESEKFLSASYINKFENKLLEYYGRKNK